MKLSKADEKSKEFFRSILPDDPRITIRPMFGNLSGLVNGNMFAGVFGKDLFLRLSDENRTELLDKKGSKLLEPMQGKPMKDYVVIPKEWLSQPSTLRAWVERSLEWTSKLPPEEGQKIELSISLDGHDIEKTDQRGPDLRNNLRKNSLFRLRLPAH